MGRMLVSSSRCASLPMTSSAGSEGCVLSPLDTLSIGIGNQLVIELLRTYHVIVSGVDLWCLDSD